MIHPPDIPLVIWGQIKALKPSFISKSPHFNFITAHYFSIIGLTLTASVLIFAIGNTADVAYVDCLFFASGANTQAGLNTVNVNVLSTFGQVVIYICAGLANPIAINSMVVFLRLYWFQRRFQNVVHEAKRNRVSIAKSRSKSKLSNDPSSLENGVDPGTIRVMHNGKKKRIANDGILLSEETEAAPTQPKQNSSSDETLKDDPNAKSLAVPHMHTTAITFANTVKRSDGVADDSVKLPVKRAEEDHIAILQRQRNPEDKDVLRIPNPRDVERGIKPKVVTEGDGPDPDEDDEELHRGGTSIDSRAASGASSSEHSRHDERESHEVTRQQTITFDEPPKGRKRDEIMENTMAITNTIFSPLRPRKNKKKKKGVHKIAGGIGLARRNTINAVKTALSRDKEEEDAPYLSWQPTMGRNSQFVGLSEEQRDELGGIEYRSLKTLALILICYFWGFELLSLTFMLPYILHNAYYGEQVEAFGVSRTWWGFFTAHSAFQDLGFTLTPNSMISFSDSRYVLLIMSFFIIIGNTGFPIMLRITIWFFSKIVPRSSGLWEELRFLLDHPRRCFTLLFPSKATWWLFWVLVILNGVDLIFFILLDLPGHTLDYMSVGFRFLNGWFVATCTRTAGFSSIGVGSLHPAVQVSYMIMMYISIFPIAISIRRTNVYEEQSLGVYGDNNIADTGDGEPSYVGAHLRRQLSFDLWFLFLAYFLLAISEGGKLQAGDPDFNMFALLFECVSAYGTVGLSLGYRDTDPSFCGQFSTVGKLLIIALQIRGRHRGLPYGLDKAILLPSESLNKKEDAAVVEDGGGLTNTMSHTTGFQSLRSSSLIRGRTRSIERPNTSLLSRVMQPGPTVLHTHVDPSLLTRSVSHLSHTSQYDRPRRANTDPVTSEDEDPYDEVARRRPVARRAETLPAVKSLSDAKTASSDSSSSSGYHPGGNVSTTTHVPAIGFGVAPAAPTFSKETTAVGDMIEETDGGDHVPAVRAPIAEKTVAAGMVMAHEASAIPAIAAASSEEVEKASIKPTKYAGSLKSTKSSTKSVDSPRNPSIPEAGPSSRVETESAEGARAARKMAPEDKEKSA
ncbi:hypothetical protein MKZ38_010376 [Zalerion maritima]|uniref:Potassium transport protein n=1 Tax=Zalerion maritima TaxID=339359 RepID=A0AAD5WXV1_9PEZI|nr:hypothetical protein MKZ38_010376 [Zalerion maritima]